VIRHRLLTEGTEVEGLASAWNPLLERIAHPTPFLSHEWLTTWWRHLGAGRELRVVVAFEDDRLAAAAPLVLSRRGVLALRVLELLGTSGVEGRGMGLSDRSGLLVPADRPDLARGLVDFLASRPDWDLLHLKAVPAGGVETRLEPTGRLRVRELPHDRSPYVPCEGTWEQYLATRSKSFRKSLRLTRNRLQREGCRVGRHEGEACVRALPAAFALNRRSWKGEAGSALFESAALRDFVLDLAGALAPRKGLVLYTLARGDELVAYELCLRGPASLVAWDAAYDPAHARWSPGIALSGFILEGAFSDGLGEYDQSRGGHAYKWEWTRRFREERQLVLVRSGLRRWAGYLGEVRLRGLAKRIPGAAALHDRLVRERAAK